MPLFTDPPPVLNILCEVMFSIKTSIHRSPCNVTFGAIKDVGAEWDELVDGICPTLISAYKHIPFRFQNPTSNGMLIYPGTSGLFKYRLWIEGVLAQSYTASTGEEARRLAFELLVDRVRSSDYVMIETYFGSSTRDADVDDVIDRRSGETPKMKLQVDTTFQADTK